MSNDQLLAELQTRIEQLESAEKERQQAEVRWQFLLEQLPCVLWSTDTHLRITSSTGAGLRAYGLRSDQLVGLTLPELFQHDADGPSYVAAHQRALQGEPTQWEVEWRGRTTSSFIHPLRDRKGAIVGVIGLSLDISEQKQAEKALHRQEELQRLVTENANDLITLRDLEEHLVFASLSHFRLMGRPAGEKYQFVHSEDVETYRQHRQRVLAGEKSLITFRARDAQGVWHWLEASSILVQYQGTAHVLTVSRDVSERRLAEERLQALSRRLVEVQENERRHLARELHDEVGQALTSLTMQLEAVAEEATEPVRARLLEAQSSLRNLLETVRQMSFDLRPSHLDFLGLVAAMIALIDRFSHLTGIRVQFQHEGVEGRFTSEVETTCYRVVQEALTNVARHAHVRDAEVRLWAEEGKLVAQVEDRGVGFDPDLIRGVLASVGLSGMRERVFLLGGELNVESAVESGTCLTAVLPIGPAPGEAL